jgi:hypothetical protein
MCLRVSYKKTGSGSISQRHGSEDPDPDSEPHQKVTDPQHCLNIFEANKLFLLC